MPPQRTKTTRQADEGSDAGSNNEGEIEDETEEIEGEDIVQDNEVDKDTDQLIEDTLHAIPTMDTWPLANLFMLVGTEASKQVILLGR